MIPFSRFPEIRVVSDLVERHTIDGAPYRALIGKAQGVLCIGEYGFVHFESREEYRQGLAAWRKNEALKSISFSSDNQEAMQNVMETFLIPNAYRDHYSQLHVWHLQKEDVWQAFVSWLLDIADEECIATTIMSPDSRESFIIHPIRKTLYYHERLGEILELGRFDSKARIVEWILSKVLGETIPTRKMLDRYEKEVLETIDSYSVAVIPASTVLQWLKEKGFIIYGQSPIIKR